MPSETTHTPPTVADLGRPLQHGDVILIKEGTPIGRPQQDPQKPEVVTGIAPDVSTYQDSGEYEITNERFILPQITNPIKFDLSGLDTLPVARKILGHFHRNKTNKFSNTFICISTVAIKDIIDAADPKEIELIK